MTLSKQQIFDKIWDHFVVNKGQPSFHGRSCLYRGPGGTKCAIGVLIPDDQYKPDFEGEPAWGLIANQFPDLVDWEDSEMGRFLRALQNTHDDTVAQKLPWEESIKAALINVAYVYSLSCTL